MQRLTRILLIAAVPVAGFAIWQGLRRDTQPAPAEPRAAAAIPREAGELVKNNWPAEEVFRRGFWRQPSAADHIVNGERIEWSDADGVSRWQWFLQVEPGAELLRDLRDPAVFGVVPNPKPRAWNSGGATLPAWFPNRSKEADFEIHQHPVSGFTLLYHVKDNTLFATDSGEGFAAPAVAE